MSRTIVFSFATGNMLDQQELKGLVPDSSAALNKVFLPAVDTSSGKAGTDSVKSNASNAFVFADDDSITGNSSFKATSGSSGLFKNHELIPYVNNPVPLKHITPDWLTIILFLTIGFFTWLKVVNNKIIQQLFAAGASNSVTNQIVRDENVVVQRASVALSLVFYFTGSLFLYQVSIFYNWDYKIINSGFARFFIFVLFIAAAYSFKMVLLKTVSAILKIDKAVSTYIFNIFLLNNIVGILFIPLVLLLAFFPFFTQYLIWTGFIVLFSSFLYRLFRGTVIWAGIPGFSLYYLILYLCALEIAPLLIIFKLA